MQERPVGHLPGTPRAAPPSSLPQPGQRCAAVDISWIPCPPPRTAHPPFDPVLAAVCRTSCRYRPVPSGRSCLRLRRDRHLATPAGLPYLSQLQHLYTSRLIKTRPIRPLSGLGTSRVRPSAQGTASAGCQRPTRYPVRVQAYGRPALRRRCLHRGPPWPRRSAGASPR